MKEFHELLKYINEYFYDDKEEKIVVKQGKDSYPAMKAYEQALSAIKPSNENEPEEDFLFFDRIDEKWILDIAIDCVRKMSEKDRNYILYHMRAVDYHFSYAMWIRNEYIHCSRKHHCFEADGVSSNVMEYIFSIISDIYDCRNKEFVRYRQSFTAGPLFEMYSEKAPEVFSAIDNELLSPKCVITAEEAENMLKHRLLDKFGKEGFIELFRSFIEEYFENEWYKEDNDEDHWRTLTNKAVLYPLEVKQAMCLNKLSFFYGVEFLDIKSEEECKNFIDNNLGLKEEHASFMAKCAWETCHPFNTGRWKKLSVYNLLREGCKHSFIEDIKNKGYDTLGALYQLDSERLKKSFKIEDDNIEIIKNWFKKWGLEWK